MELYGVKNNNGHPISYGITSSCDSNQKENRYALCEMVLIVVSECEKQCFSDHQITWFMRLY
jgi:hypothetical protein